MVGKSRIGKRLYVIIAFTLAVLIALVILMAVEINRPPDEKCGIAHEDYNQLIRSSNLGNYSRFAVAVDSQYCSTVGKNIFEKNGSAVDAAIAAALCNGVMNMQSMGIGGGHFMTVYIRNEKKFVVIDARETAPMNAHTTMFLNKSSLLGGLSTAIPGELKGYEEAHKRFGKLPWRDLFEPTIELCERGFIVSPQLSSYLKRSENAIRNNSVMSSYLLNPLTNRVFGVNDTIKLPLLAKTLRLVSESGAGVFYNGSLTSTIVDEINMNGGNMTFSDLENYKVNVYEDKIEMRLDDEYRMAGPPPPSSSILVGYILRIMRGFPLKHENLMSTNEVNLFYHRLVEAMKFAYSKRHYLGDHHFVNVTKITEQILSDSYVSQVRSRIDDRRTFPSSYYGEGSGINDHGTAHISVIAPNGDAVSMTSTINLVFGAKYAGHVSGILYNNEMDDFSTPGLNNYFNLKPSEANFIQPGKRPLSSMSPVIIVDSSGDVRLVLGASGGSKIISAVAQVAIKSLWMNENLKEAIDARRLHHQLYPEYLETEVDFPAEIEKHLINVGNKISCFGFGGSVIQGLKLDNRRLYAYSDPRKGGTTDGD